MNTSVHKDRILNSILKEKTSISSISLMLAFLLFTVLMETVFHSPVKLPGHRALPGALALLMMAEVLTPMFFLIAAVLISTVLGLMGMHAMSLPMQIITWAIPAALMTLFLLKRWKRAFSYFLLAGVVFGLARYLALSGGWHRTPELMRIAGHLAFGAVGGLAALGASRLSAGRSDTESE